jgi:uncharacterized membrane protein YhiD involved in acid resistance
MTLFTNAVIITLGIFFAAFIFVVAYRAMMMSLIALQRWAENAQKKINREKEQAFFTERRQRLEDQASQMIANNNDLARLVEAIQELPFDDAGNKTARANNNQRAKLQKTLRELVPNKGIRDIFYNA